MVNNFICVALRVRIAGQGVYFGDMFGISANYTHFSLSNNTGLLLLCEVVAKPFHEAYEFDFHADATSKKNHKVSVREC